MKILLLNQYAENKGDRAVLFALCMLIRQNEPDAEIVVSTSAPEQWADSKFLNQNKVTLVPWAWDYQRTGNGKRIYWSLLTCFQRYTFTMFREALLFGIHGLGRWFTNPLFHKELMASDLVISVGGHHYTTLLSRDLVSSINFDAMSVVDARKKLVLFSQSFGPFEFHNHRNEKLTRHVLEYSQGLYARESSSCKTLGHWGITISKIHNCKETVFALNRLFPHRLPIVQRPKRVGIAIYCAQRRSPEAELLYCKNIVGFIDSIGKQGFSVCFFPMELKGSLPDDRPMIKKIIGLVKFPGCCSYIDEDLPTPQHLNEVAKCQLFVGHKTHSTIFSLLTGTPLIGICYHPKTREFMKQFGMESYAIDDAQLTTEILLQKFNELYRRAEEVSASIFQQSQLFSAELDRDIAQAIHTAK
mgnify:CR=1 FL=1